jgi:rRNA-processing protein FCF1
MKRIILDTNFLMLPGTIKLDIFSEIERILPEKHEICIMDKTLAELENIRKEQSGADKRAAGLALSLIKAKGLKTIASPQVKNVDQLILDIAGREDLVATNDAALKKKLKAKGVPLIVLRQKKYLMLG